MTIGEVARRCGLEASAIRYYEQEGVLPKPPRVSGRRVYGETVIDRIAFVQFAREAGFSIDEIRTLASPADRLSPKMRALATRKLEEVERLIQRAHVMKVMLTRSLRCECLDVQQCGARIRKKRALS